MFRYYQSACIECHLWIGIWLVFLVPRSEIEADTVYGLLMSLFVCLFLCWKGFEHKKFVGAIMVVLLRTVFVVVMVEWSRRVYVAIGN